MVLAERRVRQTAAGAHTDTGTAAAAGRRCRNDRGNGCQGRQLGSRAREMIGGSAYTEWRAGSWCTTGAGYRTECRRIRCYCKQSRRLRVE